MKLNWDVKTRFGIYALVYADKANIQINALNVLYQNNKTFNAEYLKGETDKKVEEINKIGVSNIPEEELHELLQIINDYYGLSHETENILSNYMIVASFSFYEKKLKEILELSGKFTKSELKNCFKKDQIIKLLKQKFSIDYSALADYDKIEELRCLNNVIKHSDSGLVDANLSLANPKWVIDERIENTYDDFIRLMSAPRNLLYDLSNKIKIQL